MKNLKRIFAVIGIILLAGMYLASLIFALMDSPRAFECLKVSIAMTVIIPILLWIYIAMFRFMEQHRKSNQDAADPKDED